MKKRIIASLLALVMAAIPPMAAYGDELAQDGTVWEETELLSEGMDLSEENGIYKTEETETEAAVKQEEQPIETDLIRLEEASTESEQETENTEPETTTEAQTEASGTETETEIETEAEFESGELIAESDLLDEPSVTAETAILNSTEVILYALNPWAKEFISIPSSYAQSFQIKINGENSAISWSSEDESVAYVSGGVIYPAVDSSNSYTFNETVKLTATYNGQALEISVTVKNYASVYANEIMQEYLDKNITASMSTYEKVKIICEFVASYDYSTDYSSAAGMILSGGGDCWASTDTIITMCGMLGIPAASRSAYKWDSNVGSGHINAYVEIDGETYVADAGYTGTAPRLYSLYKVEQAFIYEDNDDGTVTITHYDGYTGNVTIPEEIDGKKVTALGDSSFSGHDEITEISFPSAITTIGAEAFSSCDGLTSVTIPATVTYIGQYAFEACYGLKSIELSCASVDDYAFFYCLYLETVHLTSSVTSLGGYVFSYCDSLQSITVDSGNKYYSSIDGVLFNKSQTVLIRYPSAKDSEVYTIPDGVTELADESFAYCRNLYKLIVASSVKTVGEYAFFHYGEDKYFQYKANATVIYFEGDKPSFGSGAFNIVYTIIYYLENASGWTGDAATDVGKTYGITMRSYSIGSLKCTISSLTNEKSGVTLSWNKAYIGSVYYREATSYYIYRKTSSGKYKKLTVISDPSTTTYTDTTANEGTKYAYKVIPYFGNTRGSGTAKTIVRLSGTSLKSVKNSSTGKAKVKWKAASGITGFQIQYSTSSTFASGNKTVKVTDTSTVKKTLKNLTKGTTYYIRIRTYKTVNGKTYYSAWSASKSVKITK